MDVLTDEQKLAMAFIEAANRGGCRPGVDELEEWIRQPGPRVQVPAFAALAQIGAQFRASLGATSESLVDNLVRLSYVLEDEHEGLSLTRLGSALLRSSEMVADTADSATSVVLGANDELAYPRLIYRLVQAKGGVLIDPYLRIDQIVSVVTHTAISRFLISEALSDADRASIRVFVDSYKERPVEVRMAKKSVLHDRLIICDDFVDTIGTSLNTVGAKYPTVLTPLPQAAANSMRDYFNSWWSAAERLAPSMPEASSANELSSPDE